jgi:hypothetical protein
MWLCCQSKDELSSALIDLSEDIMAQVGAMLEKVNAMCCISKRCMLCVTCVAALSSTVRFQWWEHGVGCGGLSIGCSARSRWVRLFACLGAVSAARC